MAIPTACHTSRLLFIFCWFIPSLWCLEVVGDVFDTYNSNWTGGIYCEDPGRIGHGVRQPDVKEGSVFPYKSQLHFTCNPGYTLQKNIGKMVCGPDGQWQPPSKPRCRQVTCSHPSIPHGYFLVSGPDFFPKTSVEVHCEDGYRLANKFVNMLECTLTGNWTGHNGAYTQELPECVEATCPPLPDVVNSILYYQGSRGWDHGFKEGSLAKYACHQGFKMFGDGNGEGRCHNGVWIGDVKITCERVGCDPPPPIGNGRVETVNTATAMEKGVAYPIGVTVMYSCNAGYALMGFSSRSKCYQDGLWFPRQCPVCQKVKQDNDRVQCDTPPTVEFGYISDERDKYFALSTVKYTCHIGFSLMGPSELTCDVNGQWQPFVRPTCTLILDDASIDWDTLGESIIASDKPKTTEAPAQTWDSSGAQAFSLFTAGCVMGILFLVLIIAVILQKHGCRKRICHIQLSSSISSNNIGGSIQEAHLCHDQDRASLIAFADGVQVVLPSYEEATSNQQPSSDFIYNGSALLHRPFGYSANRHNRIVLQRGSGTHEHNNCNNLGGTMRQYPPGINHSACQRSSSLADSLGSTDTVTPSEVSTTVTVDTLSSTMSHHTSSTSSTRAFCGSLTSFDTAGSGSILNIEGVPLLEESEAEKMLSPTEAQCEMMQQHSHDESI